MIFGAYIRTQIPFGTLDFGADYGAIHLPSGLLESIVLVKQSGK